MGSKFAIITDAHMGPIPYYKNCNRLMAGESRWVLPKIVELVNNERDLEFVIQLGDIIQEDLKNPSREQDGANLVEALDIVRKIRFPLYHVVGNHCQATLSKEDLQKAYDYNSLYYSFETNEYTNIVLHCESPQHKNNIVPESEVRWLEKELLKAEKPILVFLHHQLVEHSLDNSFWFVGEPEKAFVKNGKEVCSLLASSKKVKGVFNGHMHHNNYLVDSGIPYFTIQSMIEDSKMIGKPCQAYAIVSVTDAEVIVDVKGDEPIRYVHRWHKAQ